jgi:hypothetical protein
VHLLKEKCAKARIPAHIRAFIKTKKNHMDFIAKRAMKKSPIAPIALDAARKGEGWNNNVTQDLQGTRPT